MILNSNAQRGTHEISTWCFIMSINVSSAIGDMRKERRCRAGLATLEEGQLSFDASSPGWSCFLYLANCVHTGKGFSSRYWAPLPLSSVPKMGVLPYYLLLGPGTRAPWDFLLVQAWLMLWSSGFRWSGWKVERVVLKRKIEMKHFGG